MAIVIASLRMDNKMDWLTLAGATSVSAIQLLAWLATRIQQADGILPTSTHACFVPV